MPLQETLFCSQQIHIPPELPDMLKKFTKAAIRTQPLNLLDWATSYFQALANGQPLPVKDCFEMPASAHAEHFGLTPGLLKTLHKQLGHKGLVDWAELVTRWQDLGLLSEHLNSLKELGDFEEKFNWLQFFVLGCSALSENLEQAMELACKVLTTDPEGGPARIPFSTFSEMFHFLCRVDGDISIQNMTRVLTTLETERCQ
uniref:Rhophilin associated tail protein 1-like n=1 Tax=Eptatretus burgeri TaxID=7764 RepID=A0A8C4Q852_EPTBU